MDGSENTKDGEVRMHRFHPVLVVMITTAFTATVAGFGAGGPAWSATDSATSSTDPTGAHVELGHTDHVWRERPQTGGTAATGCRRRWIPSGAFQLRITPIGDYRPVPMTEPSPGPEYQTYQVWCDDQYLDTVWIRAQQFGVNPLDIAERLVRDLPYPAARLAAIPATRGLTGLESWFWVEGYTAAPILDSVTEFGMTVDVEATATSTSWDFGDGTSAKGLGLGNAGTGRSSVDHTFERRARPAFGLRALIVLSVRWRLNGGPWQGLDPVVRTASRSYPVVESRAALVPTGGATGTGR